MRINAIILSLAAVAAKSDRLLATIGSITILGALQASPEIKAALADRIQ